MTSIETLYTALLEQLQSIDLAIRQAEQEFQTAMEFDAQMIRARIENLEAQLADIEKYSRVIERYRVIAEKNLTSKNLLTITPRELNFVRLKEWASMIDPEYVDDPYAQRVYVQCRCNELLLQNKREEFTHTLEQLQQITGPDETAQRALLERKKAAQRERCRKLLESEAFAQFAQAVGQAHKADAEPWLKLETEAAARTTLSIGAYGEPLPLPEELRSAAKDALGRFYDAKTSSVWLPVELSLEQENLLRINCSAGRDKKLYGGLRQLICSYLRSMPLGQCKVQLLDAVHYNSAVLGPLQVLEGTGVMAAVPRDSEQLTDALRQMISSLSDLDETLGTAESVIEYNRTTEKETERLARQLVILMGSFSELPGESRRLLQRIMANYDRYGITLILIDPQYRPSSMEKESEEDFVNQYQIVMSRQRQTLRCNGGAAQVFQWYELQQALPGELVEQIRAFSKKNEALGTEYIRRIDMENIPPYRRGYQVMELPFAVDPKDDTVHTMSFENEMFASYIVGASRSGKSTLLHTLITGIIRNYHPDDVELWLADFKMAEFKQYIEPLPPHVKYILLDESPELVYDLVDKLTAIMIERQTFFSTHPYSKVSEVPPEVCHMPIIFVILDEFSIMSQSIAEEEGYRLKLQNLLAKGAALGIKFIFSSQTFTSGVAGLTPTAKAQIQSRVAMKGSRSEINETLELSANLRTEQVTNWMDALPPHYALVKYRGEDEQMHVKRLLVMYFKNNDFSPRSRMIRDLQSKMRPVEEANPLGLDVYKAKHPVVVDGNSYDGFVPEMERLQAYIASPQVRAEDTGEETYLSFGTPRKMEKMIPTTILSESRENILLISGNEYAGAASLVRSAAEEYRMQGRKVTVWAYARNRIYKNYAEQWQEYPCREGLDDVCDSIREIADKIRHRETSNELIVMLGVDRLCADFELMEGAPTASGTGSTSGLDLDAMNAARAAATAKTPYDERFAQWVQDQWAAGEAAATRAEEAGRSEAEQEEARAAAEAAFEEAHPMPMEDDEATGADAEEAAAEKTDAAGTGAEPEPQEQTPPKGAYNATEDFIYILKQGSRLGYHFLFCLTSYHDLRPTGLKEDFFRYRLSFRISADDSRELFGSKLCESLPERICEYYDTMDRYSLRPYIHKGIGWDGWTADDGGNAHNGFEA